MLRHKHSKRKCNAKTFPMNCKHCGERIYYFSCDCGCKVFFEKLGPPWPRHPCRGIHDQLLSGFQVVRINSYEYCFDSHLVERLKSAYNADRARNPKAGPGGAVRRVLVDGGIILPEEANHAWNAVARIVGHLTPSKKLKPVKEKEAEPGVEHPSQTSYLSNLHPDLHCDEIFEVPVPSVDTPPVGAAVKSRYPLTVTIPEKDLKISCRYGIDTLIEVIKELEIEEVRGLGLTVGPIPLVAIKKYDDYQQKEAEGYYIAAKTTTFMKARIIDMIGDMLEIELYVEQPHLKWVSN